MGLSKQAHGLPRFMMDCGWWRNGRRWRRPTLAEIGLHHAAVSFANEHGTDGVLPGPADDLAVALSLPVKEVRRTVPRLLGRGTLTERPDGDYEIVGFLDHNPSRSEVEADRRKRQTASLFANHQRHHVRKKMTDPDCPFCSDEDSDGEADQDSGSDSGSESQADSNNGRKDVTDRKNGTKSSSSSVSEELPREASHGDDEEDWAQIQARQNLADRPARLGPVNDPAKWLAAAAAKLRADHPDGPPPPLAVVPRLAEFEPPDVDRPPPDELVGRLRTARGRAS